MHTSPTARYAKLRKNLKESRLYFSEHLPPGALDQIRGFVSLALPERPAAIALYMSVGSEVPTSSLISHCLSRGHQVYLPVLDSKQSQSLIFLPYREGLPLVANRYGILEPEEGDQSAHCRVQDLDFIFLPLLGFNAEGYRLGMGSGYYDRALSVVRNQTRPWRVGLAWSCQRCEFQPESWDVPCHQVITEQASLLVKRSQHSL